MITVRNPHSVLAALMHRPGDVQKIFISSSAGDGAWEQVKELAEQNGIKVQSPPPRDKNAKKDFAEGGRFSQAWAEMREKQPVDLEQLFASNSENGLWLALDCLQDPHNVGAIFRAAAFFGVKGILLTLERSAPMSSAVYDVSSGGVETVPFCTQVNLQRALKTAKDSGFWVLGTSEHSKDNYRSIKSDRRWLLVLGNEETGLRRLTLESCDVQCAILPKGEVTSLNVSVAAGILISHLTQ